MDAIVEQQKQKIVQLALNVFGSADRMVVDEGGRKRRASVTYMHEYAIGEWMGEDEEIPLDYTLAEVAAMSCEELRDLVDGLISNERDRIQARVKRA